MGTLQKVEMRVSIASADWSYQVGQVVMIDSVLAKKWRDVGHCIYVNGTLPLTSFDGLDGLLDLDMEQARRRVCEHCERRRAQTVIENRALCGFCAKSEWGI